MKRLLLFSHYNKYDDLSEHVVFLLKSLQKYYEDTVIISNSELSSEDKERLKGLQSKIITRPNKGYDFAAWRDGMIDFGWKEMSKYDSVTIMNDTCFGPVYSFDPVFESMESREVDFWGIISHRKVTAAESPNGIATPEHLQSFFITFKNNVVASKVFQDFWGNITEYNNVDDVINNYETRLTSKLFEAGFDYDAFFDTTRIDVGSTANLTIYSPEKCLDAGMPLVKVKAFTHHRYPRHLVERIQELTDYPINLITDYFNEYSDPNQQIVMFDKTLNQVVVKNDSVLPSVGVHLHAFYMDVAEEFISRFKQWSFNFDLFITVSNEDLKKEVAKILDKYNLVAKEIVVLPNRGYAVIPWITVANKYLKGYDIVGHFHTKKDTHMDEWVGKVWTGDLVKMLVDPAQDIIDNFAANEKLGIVVPEVPRHARYLGAEMYYDIQELRDIVDATYRKMKINSKRIADFEKMLAYIYPYGMMYWYRPAALEPITDLVFSERQVPYGKLPDTTILHAIERLFVYVSWSKGYDYRIAKLTDYTSEFITTLTVNKQSFLKEHSAPPVSVGVKGAVKIKIKKDLKRIAKKMPKPVKAQLIKTYLWLKGKRTEKRKADATVKLFSHELSNTGGPRVALDLFTLLSDDPVITGWSAPQLFVPEGSRQDKDLYDDLRKQNITVHTFRPDTLVFNDGDIVIMNTISYGETALAIVLDNLERGIIKHLYLYPHEYVVSSYLSSAITNKIIKLMRQKKLTIYTSSVQTQKVYRDYFDEHDEVKLMPNRIDIDSKSIFTRDKDDFNKINFVITGTPDARKGELDVMYAFTSFYFNSYVGNESKYRDFSLTIVGLTDNFRDVYNKLYSDRVRVAAKALGDRVVLYGHEPEEKCLEIIKNCNFTVLYSLYECLPRVVFDGLAYGHPVLRNDCSGYEEQLVDGLNGWKTSTEDWQGLVNAIEEVLNKRKTSNQKLANMSKESVKIAKKYAEAEYIVIEDIKKLISLND